VLQQFCFASLHLKQKMASFLKKNTKQKLANFGPEFQDFHLQVKK